LGRGDHPSPSGNTGTGEKGIYKVCQQAGTILSQQQQKTTPQGTIPQGGVTKVLLTKPPLFCYTSSERVTMTQIPMFAADLLSVGKAARELHTSRWSIYRWVKGRKLLGIQLGGILFIPTSDINRFKNDRIHRQPL